MKCVLRHYLVEVLERRTLPTTFFVTTIADDGAGSFRQAVLAANSNPGADAIDFVVPGRFNTITLGSPLPPVTGPTVIDGTEPGSPGTPGVHLSGRALDEVSGATGLELRGNDITLRGLAFSGWLDEDGFDGTHTALRVSGDRNAVEGCWFGAFFIDDPSPFNDHNRFGIRVEPGADENRFGGPAAPQRNVFSGHRGPALSISGDRNAVLGNYFGVDAGGAPSEYNFESLYVDGDGNLIGGPTAAARNVIANSGIGVSVGRPFEPGVVAPAVGNVLAGSYIGTDAAGAAAAGNRFGVLLQGHATDTVIGGVNPGEGNVISGNSEFGVAIIDDTVAGTRVQGNLVGTDAAGRLALANDVGILAFGGGTLIGGEAAGARNVVAGNRVGVRFAGAAAVMQGNYVGTDATGLAALGNDVGVEVLAGAVGGAAGNRIGGTTAAARNVISGNNGDGIVFRGSIARGNVVQGNYIGLDADGSARLRNLSAGVRLLAGANGNVIGDDASAARNVVSGNAVGVALSDGASNNSVGFNYIGTDPAGMRPIPNGAGVEVDGGGGGGDVAGNVVGHNLISGNTVGVRLHGPAARANTLRANSIGTDATLAAPLGNSKSGVLLTGGADGNFIGGDARADGNVISGNGEGGVAVSNTSDTLVRHNLIGAGFGFGSVTDLPAVGNAADGVLIEGAASVANRVLDNTIAHNGRAGVRVTAGGRNEIAANATFSNAGLGIDLGPPGPTPNDPGDGDAGANDLQNFPLIESADADGLHTRATGRVESRLSSRFRIDVYASAPALADASGFGEGVRHLGRVEVVTDIGGNAPWSLLLPAVPPGHVLTATASRIVGGDAETSEFSRGVEVRDVEDITPPAVTALFLSGSEWTPTFVGHLESLGLGQKEFGFAVPDGQGQLDILPWVTLDRVSVRFGEPVAVAKQTLAFVSAGGHQYDVAEFAYDAAAHTATWLLAAPFRNDRVTLALSAADQFGVHDGAGNALDGEWSDGADAFPSGNGTAGGDFRFRFHALPGDVNRNGGVVNAPDVQQVRIRQFLSPTNLGTPPTTYTAFFDVDGSAFINAIDVQQVRIRQFSSLPDGNPNFAAAPARAALFDPVTVRRRTAWDEMATIDNEP